MVKKIVLITLTILWIVGIFAFSNTISTISGNQSKLLFKAIVDFGVKVFQKIGIYSKYPSPDDINLFILKYHYIFRKFCHFSVFLILAFLFTSTINNCMNRNFALIALYSMIFCISYSIVDEIHQTFISGRVGNVFDCLIDCSGAVFGIFAYWIFHNIKKSIESLFKRTYKKVPAN